jgi:hypothetical protein
VGTAPSGRRNPSDADGAAPSELLAPLLEEWRIVLVEHVLKRLDPIDVAMLAQAWKPWLAVVVAANLPCAGTSPRLPFLLKDFVGSAELLARARANGCPWESRTCAAGAYTFPLYCST